MLLLWNCNLLICLMVYGCIMLVWVSVVYCWCCLCMVFLSFGMNGKCNLLCLVICILLWCLICVVIICWVSWWWWMCIVWRFWCRIWCSLLWCWVMSVLLWWCMIGVGWFVGILLFSIWSWLSGWWLLICCICGCLWMCCWVIWCSRFYWCIWIGWGSWAWNRCCLLMILKSLRVFLVVWVSLWLNGLCLRCECVIMLFGVSWVRVVCMVW